MQVSEIILAVLARYEVGHIFGIPGDAINDITDALRRQDAIRFIPVRHEESGAFAAAAQAKLTGNLAACMGTAGPGAIHLLNGLYDAKMDHAPVLAITGQVETRYIGTGYHQEVDLERLFQDVALYSQTITTGEQAPAVIREACRAAVSGRGVAHISLPTDIAGRDISIDGNTLPFPVPAGTVRPDASACRSALELIQQSGRIVILAGIGCAKAREELLALAGKLGAPIVRTLRAKDVIDDSEALCIGGTGMLGGEPAIQAMEQCDLLIMAGTDFPYAEFYPEQAKVIQIDNVTTQIGKRHPVDVGLVGDVLPTISELLQHIEERQDRTFLEDMQVQMRGWLEKQKKAELSDDEPIKPQRLLAEIAEAAPGGAVFVCDTGTVDAWAARHLRVNREQRFTLSSALGSMAFALPGAIGAQLCYPDRRVFAIAGDGGFTMLMAEFLTAVQENLPIIAVILNNSKLGFIALEQEARGLPEHSVTLPNPDFAAFAEASGGRGYRVHQTAQLAPTLREAIRAGCPVVIDVQIDADELIMPPRIELKQAVNFGIARIKKAIS